MEVFRRVLVLVIVAASGCVLGACSREITRIEQVSTQTSCFSCHSDESTELVRATQQWENSRHGSGRTLNENDSTCKGCHTSEGFLARVTGVPADEVILDATSIHCFTCHAPHTRGDFQLRWTAISTLMNGATYDLKAGNLCVACHQARRDVNTYVAGRPALTSRWGPHHSPQGDMLIGSNGYEYDNYTYERSNHRSATSAGCVDCHMKTTSRNVVGGHTWNMTWEAEGEEIINAEACVRCHSGTIDDYNDVGPGLQDSVQVLITQLNTKLQAASLLSSTGAPRSVTTSADSAGAVWNYLLAVEDRSVGVHNPKYLTSLLKSSIQYIDGNLPQVTLRADHR